MAILRELTNFLLHLESQSCLPTYYILIRQICSEIHAYIRTLRGRKQFYVKDQVQLHDYIKLHACTRMFILTCIHAYLHRYSVIFTLTRRYLYVYVLVSNDINRISMNWSCENFRLFTFHCVYITLACEIRILLENYRNLP